MGFNTVAFLLNDHMHTLEKSPKTVTFLLSHPQFDENSQSDRRRIELARDFGESPVHSQALEIVPTFHADNMKLFLAGGNAIHELQVLRTGKTKDGKPTITVEAPEWFNKPGNWPFRLNMKPKL